MSEFEYGSPGDLRSRSESEEDSLIARQQALATKRKDEGNALLAANKYAAAVEKYTEAIALFPSAIFYSNRAQALIKLESYAYAVEDASEAIKLDPSYVKAYYRRGSANYAMGKLKEAKADFKAVVKLVPSDVESQKKVRACEKALRERALAEALETEQPPDISNVDVNSIVVEPSYTGPNLQSVETADGDGTTSTPIVTIEFVKDLIEHFRSQKSLHRKYILQLLLMAKSYFSTLPSLLRLSLPVSPEGQAGHFTVCGDTHGQFYDLLNIFELGGFPSAENPYLFNGDFVDRGSFSLETVTTLIALKLAIPDGLFMLRGNHESKNMNQIYGFSGEVRHKYDETVMRLFTDIFNWLPLAAVIQDSIFVVHGGISTQEEGEISLAAIEAIPRNREPPESGLMSDLLWSDPQPKRGRDPSKRGLGYSFGPDYTERFLNFNNLKLLVRSHEMKEEGYVVEHNDKCITVFSAPNYCDQMGNKGALIRFEADLQPKFTQFVAVPHPNIPPMRYAGNLFGL